eukprot:TRINITY_DN89804_c0_g1_i1.p1 TRINITY_DN89804_c0_g1~~TRINITY_DN89804_c0_g1_i1.p1  ORF type:complete len:221 (-),score=21.21 TRINITY_DN89804_c0_g1_i1:96-758(-)
MQRYASRLPLCRSSGRVQCRAVANYIFGAQYEELFKQAIATMKHHHMNADRAFRTAEHTMEEASKLMITASRAIKSVEQARTQAFATMHRAEGAMKDANELIDKTAAAIEMMERSREQAGVALENMDRTMRDVKSAMIVHETAMQSLHNLLTHMAVPMIAHINKTLQWAKFAFVCLGLCGLTSTCTQIRNWQLQALPSQECTCRAEQLQDSGTSDAGRLG